MNILEVAIVAEGGVSKLASTLNVRQNVVSNWRARGTPKPWQTVLELKYSGIAAVAEKVKAATAVGAH